MREALDFMKEDFDFAADDVAILLNMENPLKFVANQWPSVSSPLGRFRKAPSCKRKPCVWIASKVSFVTSPYSFKSVSTNICNVVCTSDEMACLCSGVTDSASRWAAASLMVSGYAALQ